MSNQRLMLIVILLCQLMVVLDGTIVNIALPHIKRQLGFSDANLSWVINAYSLAFGGLLLLGARAGDLLGRRRVFLTGIAIFSAASLIGGLAQDAAWLLTARACQGVGAAMASPSALALLTTLFAEPRERTRAIGYYTGVAVSGAAAGFIVGGVVVQWLSWRWVFFINVPIALLVLGVGYWTVAETEPHRGRFDIAGALLSTLGVTALVEGFVRAASAGWGDAQALCWLAGAVGLLTFFVMAELRADAPITPLRLFANWSRVGAFLGRLLLFATMFGLLFFVAQLAQDVMQYTAVETGFALLPLSIFVFSASQFSARYLMQRFDAKSIVVTGLLLSTGAALWMTRLHADSGYPSLVGPLVLLGIGNGIAIVPLTTIAVNDVAAADAGAASGLVNVMQQIGGALGLSVMVTAFGTASSAARAAGAPDLAARFVKGADRAFTTGAIMLAMALLLVVALVRRNTPSPSSSSPRAVANCDRG